MSYRFNYVVCVFIALTLTGCGHVVFTDTKVNGVDATIPLPDGQRVGARIGVIEQTTATVRGNTSFVTQNAAGGGVFSGSASTGRVSMLSTGPQLNEGYMTEVLTSPNVPEAVKIALAEKYLTVKAPMVHPASTKTLGAALGSGENPPSVEPVSTGLDKVIEKSAEVLPKVTPALADATKSIVNNTVSTVGDTSTSAFSTIKSVSRVVTIIVGLVVLLAGLVTFVYYKLKKKSKAEISDSSALDDEDI